MSDPIIVVEKLCKRYSLRHQTGERYTALRDVIADRAKGLFRRGARSAGNSREDFWALKDVSFEIKQGEVVGIIGRNGAGKSTLLKILSRITEPTSGRVRLRGRVASLLEVGTGFHPELTGRENIFLNGAILGMARTEIQKKFDEIVNFAEVERFLDTPVKRYSSGMYVRLAFAVAAHLEPEILLVDEVLAVGDAQFQKKCLGKMEEVSRGGRTILFVSHQMAAVQNLCEKGILLKAGSVAQEGPIGQVIAQYLAEASERGEVSWANRADRQGTGALRFESVTLRDGQGKEVHSLTCGAPAAFHLRVINTAGGDLKNVRIGFGIDTDLGDRIAVLATYLAREDFSEVPPDVGLIRINVPRFPLAAGRYRYTLYASVNGEVTDWIKHAGTFDVEPGDFFGSGQLPPHGQGDLLIDHSFTMAAERPVLA